MTTTGPGLPPNFRLNLSLVQKKGETGNTNFEDEPNPIEQDLAKTEVAPHPRPEPARQSISIPKKTPSNIKEHGSSDEDIDLDIEEIPIGKDEEKPKTDAEQAPVPAPAVQVSQLPALEDSDEEQLQGQKENKLSLLYDFLLNADQVDEPNDEWTYRSFIKEFAKSEADEENRNDVEEEEEEEEDASAEGQ